MNKDNLTSSFLALRYKLHRSAMGFLKNDEDARDALQDTFFKLWKAGGVQTETEARNKLFKVLRNICIDSLRKPKTLPLNESNIECMGYSENSIEETDIFESLLTNGLTDIQRRIYSLVIHDGMEYETIAEKVGMSVEAVRMNMSRARKKIRDNYKQLHK